jgi:hypothetical protein
MKKLYHEGRLEVFRTEKEGGILTENMINQRKRKMKNLETK